ncbi:glucose-1-phosphate cytidylyltransferase [Halobacteriovorax sp. GB3]|uniref:glucose-1-phosphate cytidylyltransferase n=1 Tax=Halobacteriovorax sp. GB3 TaxID=2719615 RepID=UPI00235F37DB|nr:glucose-1-phosphate cytidylyltransferase [Halobacteriovorax sp. GB3]MDD0852535.1 glucose-1-phosphate cytidylyltransferase [Halobacteriovorax sp. GB3]
MKVLLLAGGFGTRISEESNLKPKPMIEIGGMPILWHIMKIYSSYGFNDFVILCGYKGYYIKEYFANYFLHRSDVTINLEDNSLEVHKTFSENWKITLIDTGLNTMTGGRVKRAKDYINNEPFMLTYGDGVSNVNVKELVDFHKSHGKHMTVTTVQPDGRFGAIEMNDEGSVSKFLEKPKGDGGWINGGFFVCQPEVIDYIENDSTIFEKDPMENLAKDSQIMAYKHDGFWKPMDTLRDKNQLSGMWENDKAPWKIW